MRKDYNMPVKEQLKPANNNQPTDNGKGKIIAVVVEQDDVEVRVVRVTILIKDFEVNALFDLGCTYSFIIPRIVKRLSL